MDMLVVQGGTSLRGTLAVSGSKNAALPIMAAALAVQGPVTLHRVPRLMDVSTLGQLLTQLGVAIERLPDNSTRLEVHDEREVIAPYDLVRRMRASICVLGPLLARRKQACVSLPGGCAIGHRPIDLHLKGLSALGAEITIERGYVFAKARQLRGAEIDLAGPSGSTVTGTCNVMTAAALASGRTVIQHAACEPEVVDLGHFLNAAGARIEGLGTPTLEIVGQEQLHGTTHSVISDRIEAATLLIAAAITGGELTLADESAVRLQAVLETLESAGVGITADDRGVTARASGTLRPVEVHALPFPQFPTDVQAQLSALLCLAPGRSRITDHVFPDRFLHLPELCRLGAKIHRVGASSLIEGVTHFSGACVMASDLRASAALVLAAVAARGESVIRRIYHLDRGYEALDQKLVAVGARIQRVTDRSENVPTSLLPEWIREPLADTGIAPAPHFIPTSPSSSPTTNEAATSTRSFR